MTPRERMRRAIGYDDPDRLPVVYHPSPAGLHVHGERLLELFRRYPPDNRISFTGIPGTDVPVDGDGRYHEFLTDDWGTVWEHRIYGIAGHPYRYPIPDLERCDEYRFPDPPPVSRSDPEPDRDPRYFEASGTVSIFERLHALHPMDGVLLALAERDPAVLRLLARLEAYWRRRIDGFLASGADAVWFGDDWGAQTGPLVSPAMFREVFAPVYERLFARVTQGGARVFFHSCGALGAIFDDLLALGIDLIWPQIRWFESDPERLELCRDRGVAFYVHPDRQELIPRGTPDAIRAEIRRYADRGREMGGGVVFYVEIENDAPFENVGALIESIAEHR